VGAAAPEQTVSVDPRQAGQLAADHLEDFRRPQAEDQETELPLRDLGSGKLRFGSHGIWPYQPAQLLLQELRSCLAIIRDKFA
jgi:hypothetical protein